jgi:hypothetical protein
MPQHQPVSLEVHPQSMQHSVKQEEAKHKNGTLHAKEQRIGKIPFELLPTRLLLRVILRMQTTVA